MSGSPPEGTTSRDVVKKAAFVAPIVLTFPAGAAFAQAASRRRSITAPHVHVIQTRSSSTPASSSRQYSCSRMKASRGSRA